MTTASEWSYLIGLIDGVREMAKHARKVAGDYDGARSDVVHSGLEAALCDLESSAENARSARALNGPA